MSKQDLENKLLIVCGPTATGKTKLGIKLAKKFDGEIISADSRQVYKGMDIATGKDLPENSKFKSQKSKLQVKSQKFEVGYCLFDEIPVWMLDVVEPDEKFTVADYYDLAWKVIDDVWERGKLPIIVGGTGFYIKALLEGVETMGIEPDWTMREKLQSFTVSELQSYLKKISPQRLERMNNSDRNNPRRLTRAIEVELHKNKVGSLVKPEKKRLNTLIICLKAPLKSLYRLIDERVEKQIKAGAKKEVEKLIKAGYRWGLPSMSAMGYKEWRAYFEEKGDEEEVQERWKYNEHSYARRQMTWFRGMKNVNWFDITKENWQQKVENTTQDWYS